MADTTARQTISNLAKWPVIFTSAVFLSNPITVSAAENVRKPGPTPTVSIDFNAASAVDTKAIQNRDMTRPFWTSLLEQPPRQNPVTVVSDIGTEFRVWFDKNVPAATAGAYSRSLALSITANNQDDVKDKIFFTPIDRRTSNFIPIVGPENGRYVSFDIDLDKHYQVPKFWVIHAQTLQCCGGNPPFVIGSVPGKNPDGPVNLSFEIRDDILEREKGRPTKVLAIFPVSRGTWYRVFLYLRPGTDGSKVPGEVGAAIDGKPLFLTLCRWGYKPGGNLDGKVTFGDRLGLDLGVYRRRQATTQTVYIDRFRFGKAQDPMSLDTLAEYARYDSPSTPAPSNH